MFQFTLGYQGYRGHNSAAGSCRSKTNQSLGQRLVEIGFGRGNTNWLLKYESVDELRNGRGITKKPFNCEGVV